MVSTMTKKCMGCGILMQTSDIEIPGYTKDISMDYCMRCFKLKNYNELINNGININNKKLLKNINNRKSFVFFLVDYLNICKEIIDIYKSITNEKMLIITKSDLIYKNIIKEDLISNIKDVYDIKEDILFVSCVSKENLDRMANICKNKKSVIMTGFTNAGKSRLINTLIGSNITVSNKKNTTQDFIKLSVDGGLIYDAPGFMSDNILDNINAKNPLLPIVYQMEPEYYLRFSDICLYFENKANITIYVNKQMIAKLKVKEEVIKNILIPSNSELVIKGIGFIRFKNATYIGINIKENNYEIRPTIIGGHHE